MEAYELTLEVSPADGEVTSGEIYLALAAAPFKGIVWHGYSTEPIGYGLETVLPLCQCLPEGDGSPPPSEEDIVEFAEGLPSIQTARVLRTRTMEDAEIDSFELCWLHPPPRLVGVGSSSGPMCATVSTIKGPFCFDSWVCYHIAAGISRMYVYLDAPEQDLALVNQVSEAHPGALRVIPMDERLREEWRRLAGWKHYGDYVDRDGPTHQGRPDPGALNAKQCLNAEHAAWLAESEGMEWLMHIDCDELACPCQPGTSVPDTLAGAAALGANAVVFANHEVAPESEGPFNNPFRDVNLFKLNERLVPANTGLEPNTRFMAYGNGKSAVKLGGGVRPDGPHKWFMAAPAVFLMHPDDCCVLHYVNCGFDAFQRRYADLGDFQDKYFGRKPMTLTGHMAARDAAKQGPEALLALYRQRVMYSPEEAALLVEKGHFVHIDVAKTSLL